MARQQDRFADAVMRRITEFGQAEGAQKGYRSVSESLRKSAASTQQIGHPAFSGLGIGEVGTCRAATAFIDLRRFTARSFWDPPADVLAVNLAVISEVVAVIQSHGGHVLGLRGDGVFACFDGDGLDSRAVAGVAVGACAFALDAVQSSLNERLTKAGFEPVQVRAGADFGRLDFVRMGSETGSEVNVLGFAANFASKCEKVALAWEVVAGEGLAILLPDADCKRHADSPVTYTRDGETRAYHFYDVAWRQYLDLIEGVSNQLHGRALSSVGIV